MSMDNVTVWYTYRVYCTTEAKEHFVKSAGLPESLSCPENGGHTLDPSKTVIVDVHDATDTVELLSYTHIKNIRNTFDATVDPVSGNNATQNYSNGSQWLNVSTESAFICVDAASGSWVPTANAAILSDHLSDTANPHGVTKAQVGLGSVNDVPVPDPSGDTNGDVLFVSSGSYVTGALAAEHVDVAHTPVNYSVPNTSVEGHFSGVDSAMSVLASGMNFIGTYDITSTSLFPGSGSASIGDFFYISGGDKTLGTANSISVSTNDKLIATVNNARTDDGADWVKIDDTESVQSVAGRTGAVVITKNDIGLDNVVDTLHNFSATSDPVVSNDETENYSVGSIWVNTTADKSFRCIDASTGAAIWHMQTATPIGVGTDGVSVLKQVNGAVPEFRSVASVDNMVNLSLNAGTNAIELSLTEANVTHDNLSGAGSYTHAQLDSHVDSLANPHSVTKTQVGLGNVLNTKHHFTASSDPSTTDDAASGYTAGSLWLNTTTKTMFVCVVPTDNIAEWITTTYGSKSPDRHRVDNVIHDSLYAQSTEGSLVNQLIGKFQFAGTNNLYSSLQEVSFNAWSSDNAGDCIVTVVDYGTGSTVCTATSSSNVSSTVISTTSISNLPAESSLFEIYVKTNGTGYGRVALSSFVYY